MWFYYARNIRGQTKHGDTSPFRSAYTSDFDFVPRTLDVRVDGWGRGRPGSHVRLTKTHERLTKTHERSVRAPRLTAERGPSRSFLTFRLEQRRLERRLCCVSVLMAFRGATGSRAAGCKDVKQTSASPMPTRTCTKLEFQRTTRTLPVAPQD